MFRVSLFSYKLDQTFGLQLDGSTLSQESARRCIKGEQQSNSHGLADSALLYHLWKPDPPHGLQDMLPRQRTRGQTLASLEHCQDYGSLIHAGDKGFKGRGGVDRQKCGLNPAVPVGGSGSLEKDEMDRAIEALPQLRLEVAALVDGTGDACAGRAPAMTTLSPLAEETDSLSDCDSEFSSCGEEFECDTFRSENPERCQFEHAGDDSITKEELHMQSHQFADGPVQKSPLIDSSHFDLMHEEGELYDLGLSGSGKRSNLAGQRSQQARGDNSAKQMKPKMQNKATQTCQGVHTQAVLANLQSLYNEDRDRLERRLAQCQVSSLPLHGTQSRFACILEYVCFHPSVLSH